MNDGRPRRGGVSDEAIEGAEHRRLDAAILRGSAWTALGWGGGQLLAFVSVIPLVRLVDPKAFGLVALASPFLIALQYLQDSGLASALIHRRRDVQRAAATVLVFAPAAGLVLYGVSFAVAPLVAHIFHAPRLEAVLRVLGLLIVIRSLATVPSALLEREMDFRRRAQVGLCGAVSQFGIAIGLAVAGLGVWALVLSQVGAEVVRSALYWTVTPLRPRLRDASLGILREMARYGRYVTAGNILNLVNTTADNMVVGRLLGATSLGYYSLAFRLASLPNSVIGYIVGRVMFSVYSALQDDIPSVRRVYVQNLQRIAVLALPVSIVLIVGARPIVLALLGAPWAPVVGPLRLLAVYGLVRSFVAPTGELLKGLGRPGVNFAFGVLYAVPVIPALILLVPPLGLEGAALALIVGQLVASIPMFVAGVRMVRLGSLELAAAIAPPAAVAALLAVILVATVELTRTFEPFVALALFLAVGAASYVLGMAVFARGVVYPMWANLRAGRV